VLNVVREFFLEKIAALTEDRPVAMLLDRSLR
jgi:hypothetical protein